MGEFGPRIFRDTMNVDEVGIMLAGDSKSESSQKSKPKKGKLKKWFHNNPTFIASILCIALIAIIVIFFAIPLVQLIKGLVNAGAKSAQEEAQGPRDNEE